MFPDGTLVNDPSTGAVYLVSGGVLHYIDTPALLSILGYPRTPAVDVPSAQIATLPKGNTAQIPEGTLLNEHETGAVYVWSGGRLHYVPTPSILASLGYPGIPAVDVPAAFIAQQPRGADASIGFQSGKEAAIARLSDTVPAYIRVGSDFQTLTAQHLGNAGTSTDGFDALLFTPMSSFDGDVAALPDLDGHLSAMDYTDGVFRSGNIDPIVADTQPFLDSGDSIINTPAAGPPAADPGGGPAPISNPPAPAPSPVIGGGGGGGGGGAGRGGDPCIEGDEYPFCGPDFPIK